jgi:hypothetical protein
VSGSIRMASIFVLHTVRWNVAMFYMLIGIPKTQVGDLLASTTRTKMAISMVYRKALTLKITMILGLSIYTLVSVTLL